MNQQPETYNGNDEVKGEINARENYDTDIDQHHYCW